MAENYRPQTKAIRIGYKRTEQQEHSEAIFLTSSFVFANAEQAEARFVKKEEGNVYTRFTNPTVRAFEKRLAELEGAGDCVATASGMAAIFATIMVVCVNGDHIIATKNMFGTTIVLLNNIVTKFGIQVSWVDLDDLNGYKKAIRANTKLCLLETPSNPIGTIVDLKALVKITKKYEILLAVDNALLTPFLQKPLAFGADIVIHSATKYIDGQGRTLAGAVLGSSDLIEQVSSFVRSTGPVLSPFNAWVCLKGLETLAFRMQAHCDNAYKIANWLNKQNGINKVYYLGLKDHPQHILAKRQQDGFGGIVSFVVTGGKKAAFELINNTNMLSITANLGDTRTTITHPATTTHSRLSDEERAKSNIEDGLIRLSVGLEHYQDIINDIKV